MAVVDLHTSLPSHFLPDDDDFLAELTHRMARFLLPEDDTFDSSPIASRSHHLQSGRSEGSSQEPSSPATPEERCWKSSYDVFGMFEFENTKLNERGNSDSDSDSNSKHLLRHEINHTSNIGLYSHQCLVQEQIRAIELSGLKQESPKAKGAPRRKQEPKKGNGRRARPPRPGPQSQQPGGAGMRALFLDGPGSRGGTGVFLPRGGGVTSPSESTNKQGKGCATVLIPARVVQALQLHFDQMAATSGPKSGGFPPLHDVLVSNRDGMYSLQKRQAQKVAASIQHDTILPQEWTY